MNNVIAFCGMVLLSTAATPNAYETYNNTKVHQHSEVDSSRSPWGLESCVSCTETSEINLDSIVFLEDEDLFNLGFNTKEYLPEGFDPYAASTDIMSISFIEEEEDFFPQLETTAYLPDGFDPYSNAQGGELTCHGHISKSTL